MRDDYLWDRSGPPDPEVERLEHVLGELRYKGQRRAGRPRRATWRAMAAAAAVVLAALGIARFQTMPSAPTGWQVSSVEGAVRLGGRSAAISMPLRTGEVLRTERESQLSLEDSALGRIDLGPDSEMRATSHRQLQLHRGLLHAFIWARPGQFVVDTPSARAVDLGCEYTIKIDPAGDGLLRVSLGWVAFQFEGHESFIPAGAQCVTRRRGGPGIPFYEDAPASLAQALGRYEHGDEAALGDVLASARPRDGLTLWHLLTRVAARDRGAVFDRFAQLVRLPAGVTREAVLRRDPAAVDLCWNALELENTEWWRGWERKWGPGVRGRGPGE
jgi:hypothetical protein